VSEDVAIGNDFESQIDLEDTNWAKEPESQGGTSGFFAAVCRYYAQFLDTDFKKSRLPKRRLENKDRKGRRHHMQQVMGRLPRDGVVSILDRI